MRNFVNKITELSSGFVSINFSHIFRNFSRAPHSLNKFFFDSVEDFEWFDIFSDSLIRMDVLV